MALTRLGLTLWLSLVPQQPPVESLEGTMWSAVELAGTPVPKFPGTREAFLVFGAGGRVSGSDSCNRLSGPYTQKGSALTFGQIAATQMACPGAADVQAVDDRNDEVRADERRQRAPRRASGSGHTE